jgi:hypothetical protein
MNDLSAAIKGFIGIVEVFLIFIDQNNLFETKQHKHLKIVKTILQMNCKNKPKNISSK